MILYELSHLQIEQELNRKLDQMSADNTALVQPEMDKVTRAIASLKEDLERTRSSYESEKKRERILRSASMRFAHSSWSWRRRRLQRLQNLPNCRTIRSASGNRQG